MRRLTQGGLAVVPSFDDMLGQKPLPFPSLPALRNTEMRESLAYQNLFDSFRTIETSQELLSQSSSCKRPSRPYPRTSTYQSQ